MADFQSILPPSLAADQRFAVLEQIHAERLAKLDLACLVPRLVDTAPVSQLAYLAEEFGVSQLDAWRLASGPEAQRAVIKRGIALRKKQGTRWAVLEALRLMETEPTMAEWFESGGPRGTFSVNADVFGRVVDSALYEGAIGAIERSKNVRSHLSSLQLNTATRGDSPYVACATTMTVVMSVFPGEQVI